MMKEHDIAIVTPGVSPRPLLLAISPNPLKVFKYFTKLNRSLGVGRRFNSGILNFSLWIGSGARNRSIVGSRKIKRDQNSYCSRVSAISRAI